MAVDRQYFQLISSELGSILRAVSDECKEMVIIVIPHLDDMAPHTIGITGSSLSVEAVKQRIANIIQKLSEVIFSTVTV